MQRKRSSKSASESSEGPKDNVTGEIPPMEADDHPSNYNLKTYWVLVALRFFLTIIPQNGYIQPDEFFQSVEVVAGNESTPQTLIPAILTKFPDS
jgi:hypothetical protein